MSLHDAWGASRWKKFMRCYLLLARDQRAPSILWAKLFALALACWWASACSQSAAPERNSQTSGRLEAAPVGGSNGNKRRLEELRVQRSEDAFSNKLAIGPGDIIKVTVPGVPELDRFKVRVSADNTISLPLAGVVPVGGMTEEAVRETLYQRLEKPMKNPDVQVFVDEYHSRQVAVVGMVQKPGLHSITSRTDTILDMIGRAGGMTENASSRVLFIPASSSASLQQLAVAKTPAASAEEAPGAVEPMRSASDGSKRRSADKPDRVAPEPIRGNSLPASSAGQSRLLLLPGAIDPIEIDLTNAARESELDVPVRPGDTIIVPAAGEVMVDGWVANPGAFRIVPGMTALSAVSAAGGALFSQMAEVLRTNPHGSRSSIPIDLAKVKAGEEPDVPVQAGDVVFVKRSATGAIPYAFYEIFTKFGAGVFMPVP